MCAPSQDGLVMVTRFGLLRLTRSTHFQTFPTHSSELLVIPGSLDHEQGTPWRRGPDITEISEVMV